MTTGTATGTRIGTWTDKIVLSESKHEKDQLMISSFDFCCNLPLGLDKLKIRQ